MRLSTKQQREDLLKYEHETHIKRGYKFEEYKDLKIYLMSDEVSTWLKIFAGTSTKPLQNKRYRTEGQALEQIKQSKENSEAREERKKDAKGNKTLSSHANCAKAIRTELKKLIPNVKFSVTSDSFANGNSVNVSWQNGPTTKQIDDIVNKYAYGRFDSMTDYAFSEYTEGLAQAKYVSTSREVTQEFKNLITEALRVKMPTLEEHAYNGLTDQVYKIISNTPIPENYIFIGLVPRTEDEEYSQAYYKAQFETPEPMPTPETKESKTFEKVEAEEGEIMIVDYS